METFLSPLSSLLVASVAPIGENPSMFATAFVVSSGLDYHDGFSPAPGDKMTTQQHNNQPQQHKQHNNQHKEHKQHNNQPQQRT